MVKKTSRMRIEMLIKHKYGLADKNQKQLIKNITWCLESNGYDVEIIGFNDVKSKEDGGTNGVPN